MPRYPTFDNIDGVLEMDSYFRGCNYFNNLENSVDTSHVGFVHRGGAGAWDGATEGPIIIEPTDTSWGFTSTVQASRRSNQRGPVRHAQHLPRQGPAHRARGLGLPRVPRLVDPHRRRLPHPVHRQRRPSCPRRKPTTIWPAALPRKAKRTIPKEQLAADILAGKIHIEDVDPSSTDMIRLQDDVAQIGQGIIADHANERLGRTDAGVIKIRQLWTRELRALDEGQPLTDWRYDVEDLLLLRAGE